MNPPIPAARAASSVRRALVVDDQELVRAVLLRWLEEDGVACRAAADADEARRLVERRDFELVVADVRMPGESGLSLLRRVRALRPETSVLMLTACDDVDAAVEALNLGACGYLIKPVGREEFLVHARTALERAVLLRERRRRMADLEQQVLEQTRVLRTAHEETLHRLLAASALRDEETGAHIRRTGLLSERLARAAGWPLEERTLLRMAAPMHDVGKIGIPDAILRKPGPLTVAEYNVMKTHTTLGAEILANSRSPILQMARDVALHHHERWDGSGYPRGLRGDAIPEAARIVAIVDVFDALTHDRVYRPAFSQKEALRVLREGSGVHFDPRLISAFWSILDDVAAIADAHPDVAKPETRPETALAARPPAAAPAFASSESP